MKGKNNSVMFKYKFSVITNILYLFIYNNDLQFI